MIGMSIQILIIILSTFINVLSIIKSYTIEYNFCENKFQIWLRLIQALLISIPIGFIRMKRRQDQSQSPTSEEKNISSNNEASN